MGSSLPATKVCCRLLAQIAGLVLIGCVVGCTSSGQRAVTRATTASAPSPSENASSPSATPISVADLAVKVGCQQVIPEDIVITTEAGRCSLASGDIAYIRVFSDNNFRDQYLKLVLQDSSAIPVSYAEGDSWIVFGTPITEAELAPLS